jgi:hypothetical protein
MESIVESLKSKLEGFKEARELYPVGDPKRLLIEEEIKEIMIQIQSIKRSIR